MLMLENSLEHMKNRNCVGFCHRILQRLVAYLWWNFFSSHHHIIITNFIKSTSRLSHLSTPSLIFLIVVCMDFYFIIFLAIQSISISLCILTQAFSKDKTSSLFLFSPLKHSLHVSAFCPDHMVSDIWLTKTQNRSQNKNTQLSLSPKFSQRKWEPSPKGGW